MFVYIFVYFFTEFVYIYRVCLHFLFTFLSSGNILENKELLKSLNDTKDKSASIAASLKESTKLQDELEKEGNVYLPVANFASKMYFNLADLSKLNNMYRISLDSFNRLFEKTLQRAPYRGEEATDKRNKALRHTLQDLVYQNVARSLFKLDRLSFAMHLGIIFVNLKIAAAGQKIWKSPGEITREIKLIQKNFFS